MIRPRVGVLALQGGVDEHVGMLSAVGADPLKVRRPVELEGLDGIIIPGGESTTISKLLVSAGMLRPLQALISAGTPVWGTCAGMILLATKVEGGNQDLVSLGAIDAVVRRNAFGSQVHSHEEKLQVKGVDTPVRAVFIRAPVVESVGPGVEILARSKRGSTGSEEVGLDGPIVAIAQGGALATSFPPELSSDLAMHRYFVNLIVQGLAE